MPEIECIIKGVTDKAILIEYEGSKYWIPKSQVESIDGDYLDIDEYDDLIDEEVGLEIPRWLYEQITENE